MTESIAQTTRAAIVLDMKSLCCFSAVPGRNGRRMHRGPKNDPVTEANHSDQDDAYASATEYPVFPPAAPSEILGGRDKWMSIIRRRGYFGPKGDEQDRPLYALYRLYEHLLLDYNVGIRNELESFWMHDDWPVADIPDPGPYIGDDPQTYAVMACAVLLMLESYNEKIDSGMPRDTPAILGPEDIERIKALTTKNFEVAPKWVEGVAPLPEPLVITDEFGHTPAGPDDPAISPQCLQKNILVTQPHIYFR